MNINRIIATTVAFLSFFAVTATSTAAAEPELPACQTTPWRSEVVQQWETGKWGYLYRVIWCVENATIKWALPDIVPIIPDDSNCTWGGMRGEDLGPVGNSTSWTGFSMGWFSCPDPTDNDYPWGIVMIHPNGTSEIPGQGTA